MALLPRGLPPAITARLREAFRKAALGAEHSEACNRLDMVVMYLDGENYRKFVLENYEEETAIIKRLKLKELLKKS